MSDLTALQGNIKNYIDNVEDNKPLFIITGGHHAPRLYYHVKNRLGDGINLIVQAAPSVVYQELSTFDFRDDSEYFRNRQALFSRVMWHYDFYTRFVPTLGPLFLYVDEETSEQVK